MKGDRMVVDLINGRSQTVEVEVGGRRLTLEEPGPKESFYVIREHSGSKVSAMIMVHKDQLAAITVKVGEEDFEYKET